jgi:hypothetical protein
MTSGRNLHTSTLLSDGRVLIAGGGSGGCGGGPFDTAELYDPRSRSFAPAARMTSRRATHTATLLANDSVLITGGFDSPYSVTRTAEVYRVEAPTPRRRSVHQ